MKRYILMYDFSNLKKLMNKKKKDFYLEPGKDRFMSIL